MEINQFQGITLYAFFEAVAQQTTPLPEDLKQKMSAVGDIFAQDTDTEIDTAINQLAHLAQHPRLKPIYELTRQQIQPDYEPEELNKHLPKPENPDEEPKNQPMEYLDNDHVIDIVQSPSGDKINKGILDKLRCFLLRKI